MKKFAATNSVIPDRIKKRMSSRRVSPLAMGVNPLLLLKEAEERDQPREAKRSWENVTPFTTELMIEKFWSQALSIFHSGQIPYPCKLLLHYRW